MIQRYLLERLPADAVTDADVGPSETRQPQPQ